MQNPFPFSLLPKDVLDLIIRRLDRKSLLRFGMVNSQFFAQTNHLRFWQPFTQHLGLTTKEVATHKLLSRMEVSAPTIVSALIRDLAQSQPKPDSNGEVGVLDDLITMIEQIEQRYPGVSRNDIFALFYEINRAATLDVSSFDSNLELLVFYAFLIVPSDILNLSFTDAANFVIDVYYDGAIMPLALLLDILGHGDQETINKFTFIRSQFGDNILRTFHVLRMMLYCNNSAHGRENAVQDTIDCINMLYRFYKPNDNHQHGDTIPQLSSQGVNQIEYALANITKRPPLTTSVHQASLDDFFINRFLQDRFPHFYHKGFHAQLTQQAEA
ncbi:MAG: F-box protein, partial [Coxiellaceae bacterium]|nr:F-box protein [Coxiellaceae bacterium]